MNIIKTYFPEITDFQLQLFEQLNEQYLFWNEKINLISRKDTENLLIKHILHSLSIAKIKTFGKNQRVLDVGTGGGLPGLPLAILFPETNFVLIDSTGKKIKVVYEIIQFLKLKNVTTQQIRSNEMKDKFDYIVSRAVSSFPEFLDNVAHLLNKNTNDNGIIYLKGGDFEDETNKLKKRITIYNISDYFKEEFFETKKIIFYK